jgi:hypothetical protein
MAIIDDKLKEIVDALDTAQVCNHTHFIDQIKQAFTDEGYANPDEVFDGVIDGLAKNGKKLTGQEWYDRFEKELDVQLDNDKGEEWLDHLAEYGADLTPILDAAKKASGL